MRNAVLFLTFALLPLNVAGQNFSTPSSPRPLPLASLFLPAISIPFGNTKPELSLSGLSQTSQPDNDAIRVSLRLYGGATYLTGGDINEGVRGQNELLTTILNNEFVVDVQGEVEPVHWGVEYGGDVIIHLTPRLGIGVGVSRLEATQTSENRCGRIAGSPSLSSRFRTGSRFGPFRFVSASSMRSLPVGDSTSSSYGGVGFYPTDFSWNLRGDRVEFGTVTRATEVDTQASSTGVGFHGGVGVEFNLVERVGIFFEGQGTYAKVGGLEGTSN